MISFRLVLVGALAALLAYRFISSPWSSSKLLPVQEGDAIVVTGSHTGIGKHAALTLAKEQFTVFACVRKPEHGNELLEAAQKYNIDPTKIKPIILDVTKPEQIAAAVETVSSFVGDRGLYGLFNNAGISPTHPAGGSVEYFPMDQVRWTFEVNYFGLLQTTKAFLPLLRRRKGRILSNTSVAGLFAGPFCSAYAASKFAVEAMSDSLRRELHPHGVQVSVLEPGYISTPIFQLFREANVKPQGGVYSDAELMGKRQFAKGALDSAVSPRVTSQAVVHAMLAEHPQTRYCVGGMAAIVKFFSLLPDTWSDFFMRLGEGQNLITDQELEELLNKSKDVEFEF